MTTDRELVDATLDWCGIESGDLVVRLAFLRGVCAAIGLRSRRPPPVPFRVSGADAGEQPPAEPRPATQAEIDQLEEQEAAAAKAPTGGSTVVPLELVLSKEDADALERIRAKLDAEVEIVQVRPEPAADDIPFDAPAPKTDKIAKAAKADAKLADRLARQAKHHPSWAADRKWFQGQRSEVVPTIKYEELAAFCLAKLGKRPSAMTTEERHALLEKLRIPEKRAALVEWVGAMEGDPAIAFEDNDEELVEVTS